MFEKKYKADNERIEPTRESLLSLSYKMKREQAKKKDKKKAVRWIRSAAAVAAALVVLLGCFQIFRSLTPHSTNGGVRLCSCVPVFNDFGGYGIFTVCASTTPFGLALAPGLPWADEPSPRNLRFSAIMIPT